MTIEPEAGWLKEQVEVARRSIDSGPKWLRNGVLADYRDAQQRAALSNAMAREITPEERLRQQRAALSDATAREITPEERLRQQRAALSNATAQQPDAGHEWEPNHCWSCVGRTAEVVRTLREELAAANRRRCVKCDGELGESAKEALVTVADRYRTRAETAERALEDYKKLDWNEENDRLWERIRELERERDEATKHWRYWHDLAHPILRPHYCELCRVVQKEEGGR